MWTSLSGPVERERYPLSCLFLPSRRVVVPTAATSIRKERPFEAGLPPWSGARPAPSRCSPAETRLFAWPCGRLRCSSRLLAALEGMERPFRLCTSKVSRSTGGRAGRAAAPRGHPSADPPSTPFPPVPWTTIPPLVGERCAAAWRIGRAGAPLASGAMPALAEPDPTRDGTGACPLCCGEGGEEGSGDSAGAVPLPWDVPLGAVRDCLRARPAADSNSSLNPVWRLVCHLGRPGGSPSARRALSGSAAQVLGAVEAGSAGPGLADASLFNSLKEAAACCGLPPGAVLGLSSARRAALSRAARGDEGESGSGGAATTGAARRAAWRAALAAPGGSGGGGDGFESDGPATMLDAGLAPARAAVRALLRGEPPPPPPVRGGPRPRLVPLRLHRARPAARGGGGGGEGGGRVREGRRRRPERLGSGAGRA